MRSQLDEAELVGGALFDAIDPVAAGDFLASVLRSGTPDIESVRTVGIEPSLVTALRHHIPDDPRAIELACARGAAWVMGRRSATPTEHWELVASLPSDLQLPHGFRRTTAETLITMMAQARTVLRIAAPYIDEAGIIVVADAIASATSRGVTVEVIQPRGWAPAVNAISRLREVVERIGIPSYLQFSNARRDAPWAHLKVVVVDERLAYIGSANITGSGLVGRNLELGVLVRGSQVILISRLLDLYCEKE